MRSMRSNWNWFFYDFHLSENVKNPEARQILESIPAEAMVEFTEYELAVINYYEQWGYVQTQDRYIIENFVNTYQQEGSRIGNNPDLMPEWNQYDEPEYRSQYDWDVGGGYTDETLPQYVDYI